MIWSCCHDRSVSTIDAIVIHAVADGSRSFADVAGWAKTVAGIALSAKDVGEAVARCRARAILGGVDGGWLLLDAGLRARHRSVGPVAFRAMCEAAVQ